MLIRIFWPLSTRPSRKQPARVSASSPRVVISVRRSLPVMGVPWQPPLPFRPAGKSWAYSFATKASSKEFRRKASFFFCHMVGCAQAFSGKPQARESTLIRSPCAQKEDVHTARLLVGERQGGKGRRERFCVVEHTFRARSHRDEKQRSGREKRSLKHLGNARPGRSATRKE